MPLCNISSMYVPVLVWESFWLLLRCVISGFQTRKQRPTHTYSGILVVPTARAAACCTLLIVFISPVCCCYCSTYWLCHHRWRGHKEFTSIIGSRHRLPQTRTLTAHVRATGRQTSTTAVSKRNPSSEGIQYPHSSSSTFVVAVSFCPKSDPPVSRAR